ncbi:unnamed protein product [Rhizophagus irregularis]|uniref:HMG box domain-containing protein n=1 Tax=Rhizophagus irregularis TaxID=588596 RepID=A0A2N1MQ14_9GLOM|nr:hypothetical protein RhiirC2_788467 [Rhizophagus irregularis]CAB4391874.1 unnamed protein product [Rhizophagus irregularis]
MKTNSNRSRRNHVSRSLRAPNGFSFYFKFIKNYLKNDYPNHSPQKRMKVASEKWNALTDTEKNQYKKFANDDRVLKQNPDLTVVQASNVDEPGNNKSLVMIFSDLSSHPVASDLSSEEFFDYDKYYKD